MDLKLIRSVFTPTVTLGKLFLNESFFAFTCEDTLRDLKDDCSGKIKGKTAIDYGKHEVVLSFSNKFNKYLPLLLNVRCFEGIRIHGGNSEEDTLGCILVGENSDMKARIWNCKETVNTLVNTLKNIENSEKMFIEIVKE